VPCLFAWICRCCFGHYSRENVNWILWFKFHFCVLISNNKRADDRWLDATRRGKVFLSPRSHLQGSNCLCSIVLLPRTRTLNDSHLCCSFSVEWWSFTTGFPRYHKSLVSFVSLPENKNAQRAKIKVSRERNVNQLSLQLFQQLKAIIWREYERVNKYSRSCVLYFVLRRCCRSRGRERLLKNSVGVSVRHNDRFSNSWRLIRSFWKMRFLIKPRN
jgi:hypothetical protein